MLSTLMASAWTVSNMIRTAKFTANTATVSSMICVMLWVEGVQLQLRHLTIPRTVTRPRLRLGVRVKTSRLPERLTDPCREKPQGYGLHCTFAVRSTREPVWAARQVRGWVTFGLLWSTYPRAGWCPGAPTGGSSTGAGGGGARQVRHQDSS